MGTRNLTFVVLDGKYRVAQYCQWDGYPEGQGQTVAKFIYKLLSENKLETFKEKVRQIREVTQDEVQARWKEVGADDSGYVSMDIAKEFSKKNYHLYRDCGARILPYILETDNPEVYLDKDFAADSLFCEWAYVLDLDTNTLEVYRGFNKKTLAEGERFKSLEGSEHSTKGYYPIKLYRSFPLDKVAVPDTTNKVQVDYQRESEEKYGKDE